MISINVNAIGGDDRINYEIQTSVWGVSGSDRPNIKILFDDFKRINRIWPITESYHCRIYVAGHAPSHEASYYYDYNSVKHYTNNQQYNACFINGGIFKVDEYYVMEIYFKRDGELHTATRPFLFIINSDLTDEVNRTKVLY